MPSPHAKPPESIEVVKRTIRLPSGETVMIYIDLTPTALARFARAAVENKGRCSQFCNGTFVAIVTSDQRKA